MKRTTTITIETERVVIAESGKSAPDAMLLPRAVALTPDDGDITLEFETKSSRTPRPDRVGNHEENS